MKAARLGIGVAGALVALSIQPATALATNAQATDAPAGASVVAEATDAGVGAASASDNSTAERPVSPEVATQGAAGSGPAGEKDPASDAAADPKGSDAEAPDATEDPADATDPTSPDATEDPKGSDAGQPEVPPIADEAVFDISPELTGSATRVATQGDSGAEGTNVESGATANVLGQYWRTVSLGGSEYRFVSLKGSSALGYDSATERANVRLVGEDSDNARWTLVRNDDGSYSLSPVADRGLRLDVSGGSRSAGANLWLYAANGTLAQRFRLGLNPTLTEALRNGRTAEEGVYTLASGVADDKVVDISCASTENGANAQIWSTNGSAAQHFRVTLNADGTYSIVNAATGKSLDIACASRLSGANLQMYRTNGTDAQKWAILPGEGGLKIRSVASGLDLDAAGAVADRGTNVQQYYGNGTKAQLWSFKDGGWEYYRGLAAAREKIVQAVREQEGVRYWSMHTGPRGSESGGFGCAMLVCYAYNKVLGTDWYGSCWNLWGSANGNGGFGYPLEVTSDPEPGDIVMYLDYDSGWCEAASHAALYVGNGRVIGANGVGSPSERPWWGIVEETSVGAQAYGRRVRYIRYRWF